jgi:heme exporter protein C
MRWMSVVAGVAFALMAAALFMALDWAPVAQEAAGGLTQKIFYFHVPSAYVMYIGVTACVLGT